MPKVLWHFPRVVRDDLPQIARALRGHTAALSGRRVLITGASGMLAAHLVDALAYLNDSGELSSPSRTPHKATAAGAPARACPDLGKLRRAFGISPQVDLREGLARTIRWFQPP